jgi:hypothetical protein
MQQHQYVEALNMVQRIIDSIHQRVPSSIRSSDGKAPIDLFMRINKLFGDELLFTRVPFG